MGARHVRGTGAPPVGRRHRLAACAVAALIATGGAGCAQEPTPVTATLPVGTDTLAEGYHHELRVYYAAVLRTLNDDYDAFKKATAPPKDWSPPADPGAKPDGAPRPPLPVLAIPFDRLQKKLATHKPPTLAPAPPGVTPGLAYASAQARAKEVAALATKIADWAQAQADLATYYKAEQGFRTAVDTYDAHAKAGDRPVADLQAILDALHAYQKAAATPAAAKAPGADVPKLKAGLEATVPAFETYVKEYAAGAASTVDLTGLTRRIDDLYKYRNSMGALMDERFYDPFRDIIKQVSTAASGLPPDPSGPPLPTVSPGLV